MKRFLTVAASAALAITGMALAPQTASADITCTGTMTGSYDDTIFVPAGRTCTLNNIRLDGDVKLEANASVNISGGSISGNVQAEERAPRNVVVKGAAIDGSVQVKYATGTVRVTDARISGNIQVIEGNAAIVINSNTVGGDVQLFKNPAGTKTVNANTIDGNLQCKENTPPPTGANNVVKGNAEDQCKGLTGSGSGGGTTPKPQPAPVDVYITPGTHHVNGRVWITACSKYSSDVERCRTNIVATQISYVNGRFVQRTGEVFNNLTYKASPRTQWVNNPLGGYGKFGGKAAWTAEDGRKWRTECDTSTTGRGGCRNYVVSSVIERSGGGYRWVTKEIFNSLVRFT